MTVPTPVTEQVDPHIRAHGLAHPRHVQAVKAVRWSGRNTEALRILRGSSTPTEEAS